MAFVRKLFLPTSLFIFTLCPGFISNAQQLVTNQILDKEINDTDLVFYEDPLTFNQSCKDLAFEDFENTNVDPNSDTVCHGPFNSLTNNACYSEGALVPGFSLTVLDNNTGNLIVLTPPLANLITTAVGPNNFMANTQIAFNPAESGVGLLIVTPDSSGVLTVEVYGPDDSLLGSADLNVEMNNTGTFLGVTTPQGISRITLNNNSQNIGELLYEIQFGDCGLSTVRQTSVPTLSEWGLMAMASILGLAGIMVIRKRRAATSDY
jgi:hypothetical protein